jgi:DNA primase small subunit
MSKTTKLEREEKSLAAEDRVAMTRRFYNKMPWVWLFRFLHYLLKGAPPVGSSLAEEQPRDPNNPGLQQHMPLDKMEALKEEPDDDGADDVSALPLFFSALRRRLQRDNVRLPSLAEVNSDFKLREFSFISVERLFGTGGKYSTSFERNRHFDSVEAFVTWVSSIAIVRVDVGGIYPLSSQKKESVEPNFVVQRELVFDIDASDYDSVRYCCGKNAITEQGKARHWCKACWILVKYAAKSVIAFLIDDMGYRAKDIFCFFSGKKGVHIWVTSSEPMQGSLTPQVVRDEMVEYIGSSSPASLMAKKRKALWTAGFVEFVGACEEPVPFSHWRTMFCGFFASDQLLAHSLTEIHDRVGAAKGSFSKCFQAALLKIKERRTLSGLKSTREADSSALPSTSRTIYDVALDEAINTTMGVKIDRAVTTQRRHLTKMFLTYHPDTLRVCEYIDDIDTFDPFRVRLIV